MPAANSKLFHTADSIVRGLCFKAEIGEIACLLLNVFTNMVEIMEGSNLVKFIYDYKDHENKDQQACLNINIPYEEECLDELVTQLLNQMDPMLRFLDENIGLFK